MGNHGQLHLIKLCVGAASPADLAAWQESAAAHRADGRPRHVTRVRPKRADEVLAGGSLYWVFKGVVQARQRLLALEEVTGGDGVTRCGLVLDSRIVRTRSLPRRPFQGWRYLKGADAPEDLAPGREGEPDLPAGLLEALDAVGVR